MARGKRVTLTGKFKKWNGTNGNDTVTVKGTQFITVNAKKGNDKIYIKKGNWHQIYAGDGDDEITVTKGGNHTIDIGNGKKDKVIINGGNKCLITNFSSKVTGNVTITIKKGKNHGISAGGDKKNVTVKLQGGSTDYIHTWGGNDKIEVTGSGIANNNNGGNDVLPDTKCAIDTGAGNDTVTLNSKKSNGVIVFTGDGDDTINVQKGNNHQIYTEAGHDRVNISAGTGHTVYLEEGTNDVTLKNAQATVYTKWNGEDNISINWDKGGTNSYAVKTPEFMSTSMYGTVDTLTVKGLKSSEVTFTQSGRELIMSAAGGSVSIDHFDESWKWNSAYGVTSFANGITFDDGTLSLADINSRIV